MRPNIAARRGVLAGGLALLALVILIVGVGSLKSVPPSSICVVQEGGPFDGRGVKEVRQPSSGVKFIGPFNSQRCFPATERNYIISAEPGGGDRGIVDFFETPTQDAVQVRIEGQALFRLSTDSETVKRFYTRYGVRTFNGRHPYDGDNGWDQFL